jgi:leucyl aminopeptidase (aminopeptidase T)
MADKADSSSEAKSDSIKAEKALKKSADTVIRTCMQIRPHEKILVITDPHSADIGQALYEAASRVADRVLMVMMPSTHRHGIEPPLPVSDLMRRQEVILVATKHSITHTRARRMATKDRARIATLPGITMEMFTHGGMTADFDALQKTITVIARHLKRKRMVRVSSTNGTDVEFELSSRWVFEDNGICNRPQQLTNLPAGKVFGLPKEGIMNGKIVIDGSFDAELLEEPIELTVVEGRVTKVSGGEAADRLKSTVQEASSDLKSRDREAIWTIAEFGFGMNPKARLIGNVLEDEKVLGSCYFGIGDNSALGGSARVGFHVTGVITEPEVRIDGEVIISDGMLRV